MTASRREALERGARAEQLAVDALESEGWTILARNWRGARGEIDVVASREGRLRFVEVKARDRSDPWPEDAITAAKRRRLISAARAYLSGAPPDFDEVCFLVAMVTTGDDPWEVEWVDDAFDGS